MESLTLYHAPFTRSVRVRKLLELMDVPHELVTVDVKGGGGRDPEYLAMNPYGRVPVLRHGETVVLESGACMMYLADRFPEKGWAPATGDPARAAYLEWFFLTLASLEPALLAMMAAEDRDAARAAVRTELEGMEARLVGDFAAGDSLTAADVLLHGELWWMSVALEPLPEDLPRLGAYYARHGERFGWTGE